MNSVFRPMTALALVSLLSACAGGLDLDLRNDIGGTVDTSDAALKATADRPAPDTRGIISYPSYQVAVARRGDTLADVASRIGLPANELGRYNGIAPNDPLRQGEIVALPRRVAEPSPATGAAVTGPIRPASSVDVTTLASNAIDSAPDSIRRDASRAPQTGVEPVRHKVARGETAFTIARLYNVSPRALADWNGLDSSFKIREGQYLLIPAADETARRTAAVVPAPGAGSPTPVPPSAATPLPDQTPPPRTAAVEKPAAPVVDIGQSAAKAKGSMSMPVSGPIIREYSPGSNPGIDIGGSPGTPVVAAADGTVIKVSKRTDGQSFLFIQHPSQKVFSVYQNIADISVEDGQAVRKGDQIARIAPGSSAYLHFRVYKDANTSVDPLEYLQ
ncbi:peptidoglycan DD-metalloendopeptidase family protein [Maliponia aquimaris]|uniref:Murein hydrolase activator NlpD n=1 Tax=Maliponia aquimaris TaxID=1673631 RepID=A0A238JZT0_9RHOB|nr:peptidoglycan DD-metalloendopeptidase family protein [Maliponia aquimaris]SMX36158.1 Murein hydrolase activator NlpD precursor [Maliponia aquimaris]